MSVEMLRDANPVPPEQTAGSVHEERAQRLLASILMEKPSRSLSERLRALSRPRLVRTVVVAATLALVALAFSVTLPLGGGSHGGGKIQLGILGRAAAAIPDKGPVVHVVWQQPDFASNSPAMTLRYEEWLDRGNGTDHLIISKGRKALDSWRISGKHYLASNTLLNETTEPYFFGSIAGAPFASLIEDYRTALSDGKIVLVGPGRVLGKPVLWVRLRCPKGDLTPGQLFITCAERLALDKHTYLPVVSELHTFKQVQIWNGDHTTWSWAPTYQQSDALQTAGSGVPMRYRILTVELIPRDKANINPPERLFKH
jgi:hypothetical protein